MSRFLAVVTLWFVTALASAQAPSVYVVAAPESEEQAGPAREFSALGRAALAESEAFRVREPDAVVRGDLGDARDAYAAGLVALKRGRQAYLAFDLDAAQLAFSEAIARFDQAWALIDSPEPPAQALMFLGACHALNGDKTSARRVFARYHAAYAALAPDERVFNPQVMVEFREAKREVDARPRGKISVEIAAEAELTLDGRVLGTGPRTLEGLLPGEHVLRASVVGAEPKVARVTLKPRGNEKLSLETPPERTDLAMLLAGASDEAQARELQTALGADALAVLRVSADSITLTAFGAVASGKDETRSVGPELDGRAQAVRALVAAFLDRVAAQAHADARPAPVAATEPLAPIETAPEEKPKRAWYKKGWVWVLIGGAVVAGGATAAALMLTNKDDAAPQRPEGGTLTLEF